MIKEDIEKIKKILQLIEIDIKDSVPLKLIILCHLRQTLTHFDPFKKLEKIQAELGNEGFDISAVNQAMKELERDHLIINDFRVGGYRHTWKSHALVEGLYRIIEI